MKTISEYRKEAYRKKKGGIIDDDRQSPSLNDRLRGDAPTVTPHHGKKNKRHVLGYCGKTSFPWLSQYKFG